MPEPIKFDIKTARQIEEVKPKNIGKVDWDDVPIYKDEKGVIRFDEKTNNAYYLEDIEKTENKRGKIREISFYILFLGYPFYLLIRFIVWAIGTLKAKEK